MSRQYLSVTICLDTIYVSRLVDANNMTVTGEAGGGVLVTDHCNKCNICIPMVNDKDVTRMLALF